jgi:hypothetical protein
MNRRTSNHVDLATNAKCVVLKAQKIIIGLLGSFLGMRLIVGLSLSFARLAINVGMIW